MKIQEIMNIEDSSMSGVVKSLTQPNDINMKTHLDKAKIKIFARNKLSQYLAIANTPEECYEAFYQVLEEIKQMYVSDERMGRTEIIKSVDSYAKIAAQGEAMKDDG